MQVLNLKNVIATEAADAIEIVIEVAEETAVSAPLETEGEIALTTDEETLSQSVMIIEEMLIEEMDGRIDRIVILAATTEINERAIEKNSLKK
jgi:hypothetical protein